LSGAAKAFLVAPLLAVFAYAALVGLMYFSQRALLYPGAVFAPGDVPAEPVWGESVTIRTPDGESLHALHSPASGQPTVLLFLGNADRAANYGFLADALSERGVGLLALSYRGYPGSTGAPTEAGLFVDGLAAFDWLAERSPDGIVLLGQSLGSGVAVYTAARRPALGAVLISAYTSVEALAAASYPWLPVRLLLKDRFRSDLLIREVHQPKLFIHGRRDSIIPLSFGEQLFGLAPEPKRMLVYDAYGHNDIWSEGLVSDVIQFVESID
jgi:fermentation-respiration switch protein FrsA (DUF1100 family)